MSSPEPRYEVTAHPQAQREFDAIPEETRERLRELIYEMAASPEIDAPTKAKRLDGRHDDKVRVRAGRHRAILARDGAELRLLLVDHRDRAYDRLDTAERRLQE